MVRSGGKPMNLLVPYLDLFERLDDRELARLAEVDASVVAELRRQVEEINRALLRYADLLPRLGDAELTRLTGASSKTIRFWRLCQPRGPQPGGQPRPAGTPTPAPLASPTVAHMRTTSGEAAPGVPTHTPVNRTPAPVSPAPALALSHIEGQPFPGFEGQTGTDEDGEIELAVEDDDPPSSQPRRSGTHEQEDDDLAFELSDDDFF